MSNAVDHKESKRGSGLKKPFFWVYLLAAVAVLAGSWLVYSLITKDDSKQDQLTAIQAAQKAADRANATGNYKESLKSLQAVESQAKTKPEKVQLYSELAAAAANSGDVGKALEYLEKKHQIDPSTKSSDGLLLGGYYEQNNNGAKALEYYKLALEFYESQPQKDDATIESLKARIAALEEQL